MVIVLESKQDEQNLIDAVGTDLANQFLQQRKKFKSPYNDIYYWVEKSPEELDQFLNSYQSKTDKVKVDKSGADLIYSDSEWKVYHIKTYEASVYYGKHTQWCISGSKRWSNGERGEEYFNDYHSRGIEFYFYIDSNNDKYALALYPDGRCETFNQVDDKIDGIPDAPEIDGLPDISFREFKIDENGVLTEYNGYGGDVVIPDGVTEIGNRTFAGCTVLTSVKIPNSVTKIGKGAFYYCTNLTGVKIPNSVTEICSEAFYRCENLIDIVIPNSVIEIGDYAFYSCYNLTSIAIPNSITEMGIGAFGFCRSLTDIAIPNSVTEIGAITFWGCTSLTDISIPNSVTYISSGAFSNCESLTDIVIPNSVIGIDKCVFNSCENLTDIVILSSVTEIDKKAFMDCDNFAIHCKKGSYAEQYCIDNGIEYDYNI